MATLLEAGHQFPDDQEDFASVKDWLRDIEDGRKAGEPVTEISLSEPQLSPPRRDDTYPDLGMSSCLDFRSEAEKRKPQGGGARPRKRARPPKPGG